MNGVRPKIEIFKPFGQGFEITNKILFQPFDLKKWLVIGFAAFLSGHLAGIGFNFPSPFGNFQSDRATHYVIPAHLEQWKPWLVAAIVALALLFFAFVIALTWLKARGNFIFTDCIVRNRAAIAEPWREYRKEGNSYFLFLLAIMFAILLLAGLILAGVFGLGWLKQGARETESTAFIGLIVFFFVVWALIVFFVNIATYFMVPVMYRKRCRAVEAFRHVTSLIMHNVGSFFLFCLFGIVLILAALMIGAIVTCASCCLAALPYIGTVILLPVFVCLRAFTFAFLRQFGPDYDVWVSFMPVDFVPILSGASPSTPRPPNLPPEPPSSPSV
jgi:membrane-anchored glycerophosphoryl diester phosphodiesterase (GDPDase)